MNLWRIASSSSAPWLGMVSGFEGDEGDVAPATSNDDDPPDVKVSQPPLTNFPPPFLSGQSNGST